jgi:uracil-DNA glycosylase family 4
VALAGPGDCGDLPALRAHIGDCRRCPLGDTRTHVVFGVGDPRAELLFVGEAPGRNEDLKGEPFVGAAGRFLDELLESIGLVRSQVYIANVLKCRPPDNRDPLPEEIATCTPFLARQIELIAPRIIVTLGKFATQYVLETTAGITQLRGRLYRVGGRRVVPVLHPAAALYNGSVRQVMFDDFKRLRAVLDRPDEDAPAGNDDEGEAVDLPSGTEIAPVGGDGSSEGPAGPQSGAEQVVEVSRPARQQSLF